MDHGPSSDWGEDKATGYKTKVGVIMVIIYGIIYGGFILINTLNPKLMGVTVLLGVNLAIIYGFGLIILAIIMGVIYNYLCTKMEDHLNGDKGGDK